MRKAEGNLIRLYHIRDALNEIINFIAKADFDKFVSDSMIRSACIRQLEIIGEAAKRVTDDLKTAHQEIPWSGMIGLRNMLIHEYFGIDDKTLWEIITLNVPELKTQVIELIRELENKS